MAHIPNVLFVCVHNAGRSQMAAGFLTALAEGRISVDSAGSAPADAVNPIAIAAMAEVGVDISHATPQTVTDAAVAMSDVVITMGCGDCCPYFPGISYRDWAVSDPAGHSIEALRPIRDHLRILVDNLIAELVPAPTG